MKSVYIKRKPTVSCTNDYVPVRDVDVDFRHLAIFISDSDTSNFFSLIIWPNLSPGHQCRSYYSSVYFPLTLKLILRSHRTAAILFQCVRHDCIMRVISTTMSQPPATELHVSVSFLLIFGKLSSIGHFRISNFLWPSSLLVQVLHNTILSANIMHNSDGFIINYMNYI